MRGPNASVFASQSNIGLRPVIDFEPLCGDFDQTYETGHVSVASIVRCGICYTNGYMTTVL